MGALRLALLGAFPYPLPQGSQIYFEAQARALARAGCDATLVTYGRGQGAPPVDLRVVSAPAFATPSSMRSGPSFAKPFADAALLRTLVATCRSHRFDAVLAHNAEAAAIAIAARRVTHVPVVYVVHTLLGVELSAYLPSAMRRIADAFGTRIDRMLARRADGLITLAHSAEQALRPFARGPLCVLPPGLEPGDSPLTTAIDAACRRHGLQRDRYALYSGNLDAYQELELLAGAAERLPEDAMPIVVATHAQVSDAERRALGALHVVIVDDFAQMRALTWGAATLISMRRRIGGYPVKLLNYMEAGRSIIAFEDVAEGLAHGESAWLLDSRSQADATAIADRLMQLQRDDALRARLGRGARAHLERVHDWHRLAARTVMHVDRVIEIATERA